MRGPVLLLFFLSGALGLVYQVVWTRLLTQVLGTTALAVGIVLAAFMSGLALGSWLLGRLADRVRDPLRTYAWLELAVGVSALGATALMGEITPLYVALHDALGGSAAVWGAARFALAFALVLAPTCFMGATLPVLTRFAVRELGQLGARLSTLYTLNALGAVVGTLGCGFFLIRELGMAGSVYVAVLGNLLVGAAAWLLASRRSAGAAEAAPPPQEPAEALAGPVPPRPWLRRLVLFALAVSGLTSFAYEIYWTRALVFLLGNSTYAVTTMLTAFLLGIALGGWLVRFLVDRALDRFALFGWIQVAIGASAAWALPLLFRYADTHALRVSLMASHDTQGLLQTRFLVSLATMLLPATLVGTTFPLVARLVVTGTGRLGSTVGRVYAVNTVGNVAGALLPGLFLLAWLGIGPGILAMALLNLLVGVLVLFAAARDPAWRAGLVMLGLLAGLLLAQAPSRFQFPSEGQQPWHRVLYYREGPSATTTVLLDPDTRVRSMFVDGIEIGGGGFTDFKQKLLAHLPKLLAADVARELSVGMGSSVLIGESARHALVQSITCVEIEPSVVEGAAHFRTESHAVLEDPRLGVVVEDVANHLLTTTELYDVISADEKTAQEYASNGFSYSREYYQLLRARLAPRGLVVQWVPTTLPAPQYRMVLRTFSGVFPECQVWYFPPALVEGATNTLLVGALEPLQLDCEAVRGRFERAGPALEGLTRYGITSAEALLAHLVARGETLRQALRGTPENTLDRPRYEFFSPAEYAVPRRKSLVANQDLLAELRRRAPAEFLDGLAPDPQDAQRMQQARAAEAEFLAGYRLRAMQRPDEEALARFEASLELAPWNDSLRARVFLQYWEVAGALCVQPTLAEAAALMQHAFSIHEGTALARVSLAIVLERLGRDAEALEALRAAVRMEPTLVAAWRTQAELLQRIDRPAEAQQAWRALLEVEPTDAPAQAALARLSR